MADSPSLDINWSLGTPKAAPSPKVAAKQATVQEAAIQKQALFGSEAERRVIATAELQGNRVAQTPEIQDILGLNAYDFAQKYGHEAEAARVKYGTEYLDIQRLKRDERSNGEMASDSAIDVGLAAANMVGGTLALGANALDSVRGTTLSPMISEGMDWVNDQARGAQSPLMQERRLQHEIEGALNTQDREARYQERLAENPDSNTPWLRKQGETILETVQNFGDDPIMRGSLVPEGIGSLAPNVAAIKLAGKANALRMLARDGVTGDAAEAFLKTPAGREMLERAGVAAAPAVVGVTESGAAVNQTQQDIMGMDEAALRESPEYRALLAEGLSPVEAQRQLAREAGSVAGVLAAPGAILAGKISAPFAANPLRLAPDNAIRAGAQDMVKETVEEFIQEGNTQLMNNVGVNAVGIERALDEGVAEAGTVGALSGMVTSGSLQSPGMVREMVGEVSSDIKGIVGSVVEARKAGTEATIAASDPVGPAAQAKSADVIQTAGDAVVAGLTERTTPKQTEPNQTEADAGAAAPSIEPERLVEAGATIQKGRYLSDDELASNVGTYPGLQALKDADPKARVPRKAMIDAAGAALMAKDASPEDQMFAAMDLLANLQEMRKIDSTPVGSSIGALDEADPIRGEYEALKSGVSVIENSAAARRAQEVLAGMTPETVRQIFPLDVLQNPDLDEPTRNVLVNSMAAIAEANPTALKLSDYDLALNQAKGLDRGQVLASLKAARSILDSFQKTDETKAAIKAAHGQNPGLPKTTDIVREEIRFAGNSDNRMPSLEGHRSRIVKAAQVGRTEEATALMDDLRAFSQSLANKVGALNQSVIDGKGEKVPFKAFGPFGMYSKEPAAGVWANARVPGSVAMVRNVHADAVAAAELVDALSQGYGIAVDPVTVPDLHPSVALRQVPKTTAGGDSTKGDGTSVGGDSTIAEAAVDTSEIDGLLEKLRARKGIKPGKKPAEKEARKPKGAPKEKPKADDIPAPVVVDEAPLDATQAALSETKPAQEETADEIEDATEANSPPDSEEEGRLSQGSIPPAEEESESPAQAWFKSLQDVLPKTLKGLNVFLNAFKPKKGGSTLTRHDDPIAWLRDNLAGEGLTENQVRAITNTLDVSFNDGLVGQMQDAIDAFIKKKGWSGDKVLDNMVFREALPLNLTIPDLDGNPVLEPRVMAATVMAAWEWTLANTGPRRTLDDEAINKAFGKSRGARVTREESEAANFGPQAQVAIEQIAQKIMTLLDVAPKDDVSVRQTQGLFRSLAASSLEVLLEHNLEKVTVGTGAKARSFIRGRESMLEDEDFVELQRLRDPFTRIFTQGQVKPRHVDTKPPAARDTQIGNALAKLKRTERKVVSRLQDTPSYVNAPMAGLSKILGEETMAKILGFKTISPEEEKTYNPDHLKKIKGKNRTIQADLGETLAYVAEAEQVRGERAVGEVPIYFEWRLSSVGRLQQMGPVTPQGSKIARELLGSTNSVLDLDNEKHERAVWLAVAQSLGVKVEKRKFDGIMRDTKTKLDGGFAPVLEMLRAYDLDGELDGDLFAERLAASREEVTPKAIHALLTAARVLNAVEIGRTKDFRTALAFEADGKTDGPINAMVHMGVGEFTPKEIERFAKGGFFFANRSMSLAQFIEQEGKDGEDLYNMAAEVFQVNLKDRLAVGASGQGLVTTLRVLDAFLPDFRLGKQNDEGEYAEIKIGRNVTKNPLTVFLYGSGDRGVAGKIAGQVADAMAVMLTQIAQSGKSVTEHELFGENATLHEDIAELMFQGDVQRAIKWLQNPTTSTMTGEMHDALTDAILLHFAEPMIEAVDQVTGGLGSKMRFTQKVATTQTLIFQDVFKRELAAEARKRTAERDAEAAANQARSNEPASDKKEPHMLLSEAEVRDVFARAMKIAPIYGTDLQSFHIAAPVKAVLEAYKVSEGFQGTLSARASYIEPADASVKVSPYLTIGTGDGRMILNIYANGDVVFDRSLPVFDGVELGLEDVEGASQQINQQVFEGWMDGNPYQAILDGFDQMLASFGPADFALLSKETKDAITQALELNKGEKGFHHKRTAHFGHMNQLRSRLESLADEAAARKTAMRLMGLSVDHMAGAEGPYVQEGQGVASGLATDYQAISDLLNVNFNKALENIKAKRDRISEARDTTETVQAPNEKFLAKLEAVSFPVAGHPGVRRVIGANIMKLLTAGTETSADVRGILKDMAEGSSKAEEALYFFGSVEDLQGFRDTEYEGVYSAPVQHGQYLPRHNVVLIANASPETLAHEMLHAHTARVLIDHYADPEASAPHVKFAVSRLEELKADVMALTVNNMDTVDATAVLNLQDELVALEGRPSAQVGELISWMLTNQHLIEKGKKVQTYRPLMSLIQKGLALLKKALGLKGNPGSTLFSNIRFNAQLLTLNDPKHEAIARDMEVDEILNQSFPGTNRLTELERIYFSRLRSTISGKRGTAENVLSRGRTAQMLKTGREAAEAAVLNGFTLDPRQARAFEAIHATVASGLKAGEPVGRHLYEAFGHVAKTLKPGDFLKAWGVEANATQAEKDRAKRMADFVVGAAGLRTMADGRTDMLASFLALSLVDDDLRQVLITAKPPKVADLKWDSFDDWLRSIGTTIVNLITRMSLSPRLMKPTMREEIDALSDTLTEIQGQRRLMAAMAQVGRKVDQANDYISSKVGKGSQALSESLLNRAVQTTGAKNVALSMASVITALGSKDASAMAGENLTMMMNLTPSYAALRSALSDIRGMTERNAPLLRLINQVKARIDQLRQDFREGVPAELAKLFKTPLKREEWSRLHSLGKADVLALGHTRAMDLLRDPSTVAQEILDAEDKVRLLGGKFASRYQSKAKALAWFMTTGEVTSLHLLPNARAIARLLGQRGNQGRLIDAQVSPDLVEAIDELTTLYAFDMLDAATKDSFKELMAREEAGMETLTGFLNATRQMEIERQSRHGSDNDVALNNGWKGYVPTLTQAGASLIVADATRHDALLRQGYVKVGDFAGDRREGTRPPRAYYQSSVAGKSAFRQGVAQTVNDTWQGVDAQTGQTLSGSTAGVITGSKALRIARDANKGSVLSLDGQKPGEYLIPRFDVSGEVVAYERAMDPKLLSRLPKDDHLGRMLGVWAGRILEENAADESNTAVVDALKEIHDRAVREGTLDGFVNVAQETDPVIQDAWNTLGWRIKADIEQAFGPDQFPVRREMVDDAIGYRAPSVTDMWTGTTRWSPKSRENIRDLAETMMGVNAFKWLKQGESLVNDLVSYAKTTIIVRSVAVGAANLNSNVFHLSLAGVPFLHIMRGMRAKFSETTEYVKNREEIQRLQVRAAGVAADPARLRQISSRIQALEEANGRLSIAPLLEAGEFSTISENLTEADVAIREGRWADYLEKATDKLPGWGQTAAKNLLITKDTALFQGLNRFVQYGDFVAKAVLYDHLTKTRGKTKREALDEIFDEFVPYNRLPGRGRDFLESMGLMWFWNYKLRIMKVVVKTIRDRPLNSLLMMGGAAPGLGVDSVWDGSLAGAALDGRIGYSIGPEMGFNAPSLHPVIGMAV